MKKTGLGDFLGFQKLGQVCMLFLTTLGFSLLTGGVALRARAGKKKFTENIERDEKNLKKLESMGWKTVSVWECDLVEESSLINLEKELLY